MLNDDATEKFDLVHFSKVQKFVDISKILKNLENLEKPDGGAPALRVIRAGKKLTAHRSLPY